MKTSQTALTLTAVVLALGMLLGAGAKCSMDTRAALTACIESTGKPLECRAAVGNPAQ